MSDFVKGIEVEKVDEIDNYGEVYAHIKITAKVHKVIANRAGVVFDNPGPWHSMELDAYQRLEHWQCESCYLDMNWRTIEVVEITCDAHVGKETFV